MSTEDQAQPAEAGTNGAFSLQNILSDNHSDIEAPSKASNGLDEDAPERGAEEGFCIECEGACIQRVRAKWFAQD